MPTVRPLIATSFAGTCPVGLAVGDVVYVAGPGRAVDRVDITDRAKVLAAGILTYKSGTSCTVLTRGPTPPDLYAGTLVPGALYFVDAAGRPTAVRPTGFEGFPHWCVVIGRALDVDTLDFNATTITGARS